MHGSLGRLSFIVSRCIAMRLATVVPNWEIGILCLSLRNIRVDLIHDTYQFSPRSRIDGIKARQDKGDREGIPQTHLIP